MAALKVNKVGFMAGNQNFTERKLFWFIIRNYVHSGKVHFYTYIVFYTDTYYLRLLLKLKS